ncbi:MAG: MBL fold metallo-hydrolase, partial [Magnetospirillum sp. WYHS-4]
HAFFDPATSSLTYVAWDELTRDAVVIDPVLDYDPATHLTSAHSLDRVSRLVRDLDLNVHWILDTHAHADHLTAGRELRARMPGARWGMASALGEVFSRFREVLEVFS